MNDTGSAATAYTDDTVAAGTPYTYRIKAINGHGVSERSRWFHIDTPAAPTPEPTPEPESVSEGDSDLPNDNSTPGRVAVGGSATGAIGTAGDQDRFAVELEAGRTYQFDLTGSPGGGGTLPDTFFRAIYDSEGSYQPDSYNDDFEDGRDSRVTFTASESGTYYARVSGDRNETGSYTLSVTDVTGQEAVLVPGPPETEPESSQGQSTPGAGGRANVSEPDGEDLPADTTTIGEVDVGGSVTGNIGPSGSDHDWFAVELEAGKRYQIDLEGTATGRGTLVDPWLPGIYDSSGNYLLHTGDDDGGEGFNSRTLFTPDASGTYYVAAAEAGEVDLGIYALSVRDVTPPAAPHLEGDTDLAGNATTRGEVEVGGLVAQGTISEPVHREINNNQGQAVGNNHFFDRDWFKVTLQAGRTYRIDLAPLIHVRDDGTYEVSLYPEIVALYDADSNYLHYTSDRDSSGPGYAARVEFTPRASGAYYISVVGLGLTPGEYELTVSDITQDADQYTADRGTSGRVAVGRSTTGTINSEQDVDWFKVTLTAGTGYRIDLEGRATDRGSLYDPWLRGIFDADGNEIPGTRNDDGGVGLNSRLLFTPTATGFYYVAVGGMAYHVGSFTLSVDLAN